MDEARAVQIVVELTDEEAWDLAQFLKRVTFTEYEMSAVDQDEAYRMQSAAGRVRRTLAEAGYDPR